jgi:hypothetical protein
MFAIFNDKKQFIGYSDEIPPNSPILRREVPSEKTNISNWEWKGDYETGEMLPIGSSIEEIQEERHTFEYIDKKYPLNVQLITIMKQLRKIIQNNDNLADDDFYDMSDCILTAVDKFNKRISSVL